MIKKISFLALCLFCLASVASAKDVKIVVKSDRQEDVEFTILKFEMMTKTVCTLTVKNGINEFTTDKIDGRSIYHIGYRKTKRFLLAPALIDPKNDTFFVDISDDNYLYDGENKGVNETLCQLEMKYKNATMEFYKFENITKERGDYAFNMYENMLTDIQTQNLPKDDTEILKGYAQGVLLQNLYAQVFNSKVFGKTAKAIINDNHDDCVSGMKLNRHIALHSQWYSNVIEFFYTKINNGTLKIRGVNSWLTDIAKEIKDKQLRDQFILAALKNNVVMEYSKDIMSLFESAKKLITDATVLANVNELELKAQKLVNINEGEYLGDFTFEDAEGNIAQLSKFKGKYVLIDMWSTGCNPCIGEMPYMKKIEHSLSGREIEFVSISMDSNRDVWKKFLKTNDMKGNQLLCVKGYKNPFCSKIGLRGIPQFILLDKATKILNAKTYRPSNPVLSKQLEFIVK